MRSRRKAREVVLQVLYCCDTLHNFDKGQLELLLGTVLSNLEHKGSTQQSNLYFARNLVDRFISNQIIVDQAIVRASKHWTLQRMARVDRNILRLAATEILFENDVPARVSINEAVELAKDFGTEDSHSFVNGILDAIARTQSDRIPINGIVKISYS